jgi:hypothetical protein
VQHRVTLFPPPSEFNFIFWFIVLFFYYVSFVCYFPLSIPHTFVPFVSLSRTCMFTTQ